MNYLEVEDKIFAFDYEEFESMAESKDRIHRQLKEDFDEVLIENGRKRIGALDAQEALEIIMEQMNGKRKFYKQDIAICLNAISFDLNNDSFIPTLIQKHEIRCVSTKDAVSREEFLLRNKNPQAKEVANMFWPV